MDLNALTTVIAEAVKVGILPKAAGGIRNFYFFCAGKNLENAE
jgi:hypothetical protein